MTHQKQRITLHGVNIFRNYLGISRFNENISEIIIVGELFWVGANKPSVVCLLPFFLKNAQSDLFRKKMHYKSTAEESDGGILENLEKPGFTLLFS